MNGILFKEKVRKLPKPCSRCSESFVPYTKSTKLCDKCFYLVQKNSREKRDINIMEKFYKDKLKKRTGDFQDD
jgi:ribosomal protein S27AE